MNFWIGLQWTGNAWVWMDSGDTLDWNDWNDWHSGTSEPNGADEDCVASYGFYNDDWIDISCDIVHEFICETTV